MCSDFQLTMKQALEEVERYKQVFTSVFMLDEESVGSGESAQIRREMQTDHRFTDKLIDTVIKVCRAALTGEAVLSKLVFSDTEIYQITAIYITADGKPYIIGMVKSIDPSDSLVLDGETHSGFAGKLASYHEKMYKDILTNVYNRRYYEEQLKSNRMSAGVAVIDLDGFDLYNSTYGHDTGDLVLASVAATIEDCISPDDTLIRYGGDEFLLIIPEATKKLSREYSKISESASRPPMSRIIRGYISRQASADLSRTANRSEIPFLQRKALCSVRRTARISFLQINQTIHLSSRASPKCLSLTIRR